VVAPVTGELPIYITENGSSWYDYVTQDGRVTTYERMSYLRGHLAALHAAIATACHCGVLRLVAARQLRVGRGVRQAVRARLRRLRHAAADP
jgi:hypothetical protein